MLADPALPPQPEAGRDRGLVREIGAQGVAVTVFNTVVGAGIFILPATLARAVGPAAPLAYLACVVAMGGVVLCFAAAGSRVPTSGGPYGYAAAAFGPLTGFLVGVLIWLGAVLAAGGIASAVAQSAARLVPALAAPVARALLIVALFAAYAAINIAGVSPGKRLVGVFTVAKLAPLGVFLVVGAVHVKPANLAFAPPDPSAFGRAMILAAFAFQGMEGALGVSGEVRDPARTIPRALLGVMAAIAVLYVAIQLVAQGVLGQALKGSSAPLSDALAGISPGLAGLLAVGASVSMLGYLAGDTLSAPRVLFALARDGFLPKRFAALQSRTRAPYAAILLHVAIGCALAVSGSFAELAILSALATVCVYLVSCAAAVVGAVGMGWIAINATPIEAAGLAAVLAASTLWYLAVGRRRRKA